MGEPWVKLEDGISLHDWSRSDEIAYNQEMRQEEKHRFFRFTFDFLTDNRIAGEYWEFGCHRARTFRMALTEARRHNLHSMRFVAFDSFEGLPEPKGEQVIEIWKKGALSTSEQEFKDLVGEHGIYTANVETVRGFYSDSLSGFVPAWKPALINVDCDLYESAQDVFTFIEPHLQEGTVIYLDDLFSGYKGQMKGVRKAFAEYQKTSRWTFVEHMQIGWWGRSYITSTT